MSRTDQPGSDSRAEEEKIAETADASAADIEEAGSQKFVQSHEDLPAAVESRPASVSNAASAVEDESSPGDVDGQKESTAEIDTAVGKGITFRTAGTMQAADEPASDKAPATSALQDEADDSSLADVYDALIGSEDENHVPDDQLEEEAAGGDISGTGSTADADGGGPDPKTSPRPDKTAGHRAVLDQKPSDDLMQKNTSAKGELKEAGPDGPFSR